MAGSSRSWRLLGPAVRSSDFGSLHETLLITAVTTVLFIRTQLWLTNYPQLGGHGLHIAHLLWGGMFMLVAIALLLTFLGRPVRQRAAIVGGVGFGFFIDELGKFITSDNNYFYKPAAALIYLIFVVLFVLARWAQRSSGLTRDERIANAIDLLGEASGQRLDERRRAEALALLDGVEDDDPMVAPLRSLLIASASTERRPPSFFERAAAAVRAAEERLTASPHFPTVLCTVFAVWALISFLTAAELALSLLLELGGAHPGFVGDGVDNLRFVNVASIAASLVAAVLVAHGIVRERAGDRNGAITAFQRALLISILVVQVFSFYESQFGAVFGLAVDLLLLLGVRRLGGSSERTAYAAGVLPSANLSASG
ncbi:hypothetical protein [Conexibacter woesei]|uniref:Uncharacterized protein n=1 Tax=Conexibacter woesei (strain DSM 14684 / CCUG 47730 / CIP 108061 / JCM 11494 / NBRC 100937 / ID131577) TaxID=469383 RepID=D3FD34_CONWI|nr:hypothetical protein [Conexibacter woesei]ADB51546.1 hypothetical protein Cwoe_3127 [Conexibacter woesei DSM 14684]